MNHQCVATIEGQNSYTSSLVLTRNFLYTGSSDREIRTWNVNTGPSDFEVNYENISTILAGKGAVKALVASSDKLISAHQDHKIRVWKIDQNDSKLVQLATLPTLGDRALKLLVPKNHVQIRRHKTCTWVHHVDTVSALALSKDESLLYSVSWDRALKIWRTADFHCLESVANAHDDSINAIVLSEGGYLYTASSDKKIKLWKQNSGRKTHTLVDTLEKHGSGVNALALSRDGSVLYSGGSDGSVFVWTNVGSGGMEVVSALRGHTKAVLCLAVELDSVFSGSADNTVRIWSGKTRSCLGVIEGHMGPVKCIAVSVDHCSSDGVQVYMLYSASLDCDIKVWKVSLPVYSQVENVNHS
ncbi:Transducin/WD40 repeat-like superfamily protein [Striga hermonthica]|uniref:Transducin/WD40 repeat-like superfamily protein n=1 Tax=Striga hermonthica TaxID=68872 RepID=A0A9N7N807_STRHE|nr:Transducin/WD40 repeat-like superfamily protein [Striga hermonthica]